MNGERGPLAPAAQCTSGRGERTLLDATACCATCGFHRGGAQHCFLYERCDRCADPEDPCATATRIRQELSSVR